MMESNRHLKVRYSILSIHYFYNEVITRFNYIWKLNTKLLPDSRQLNLLEIPSLISSKKELKVFSKKKATIEKLEH